MASNDFKQCGKIARSLDLPLFGNGDIMSYEEYHVNLEKYSVDGAMVGRAALIKPWIFTGMSRSEALP